MFGIYLMEQMVVRMALGLTRITSPTALPSVEGYSKFGSYTGNGSTDGPFVYCGFRPAFVMVKRTDSADNWNIVDVKRDTGNVADHYLNADASSAEGIFTIVDILSNGFKARDALSTSVSGGTYIFMAFAESPFKYANAR
jgi:hypothetical protein